MEQVREMCTQATQGSICVRTRRLQIQSLKLEKGNQLGRRQYEAWVVLPDAGRRACSSDCRRSRDDLLRQIKKKKGNCSSLAWDDMRAWTIVSLAEVVLPDLGKSFAMFVRWKKGVRVNDFTCWSKCIAWLKNSRWDFCAEETLDGALSEAMMRTSVLIWVCLAVKSWSPSSP